MWSPTVHQESPFYQYDIHLDPMTLILKPDLDMVKMTHHTKNKVSMSRHSKILARTIGGSRGGATGACPPQQDQFLSFSHMFSPKCVCVRGWCPPATGRRPPPPQREILDPPLRTDTQRQTDIQAV